MAVQPGLGRTWSETPKTGFLRTRLILHSWKWQTYWLYYPCNATIYHVFPVLSITESSHEILTFACINYANREGSGKPAHARSLTRVFPVRIHKEKILPITSKLVPRDGYARAFEEIKGLTEFERDCTELSNSKTNPRC